MIDSRKKLQRRYFSLPELIVAMTLLLLLMGLLFRFIVQAQKLWQLDETNARIYQNSRTIFNIVGRDLQGMATSDIAGREIYYTTSSASTNRGAWVTTSGVGVADSDFSKLVEVGYSVTGNSLERYMTSSGSVASPEVKWNFFNTLPATWGGSSSWGSSTELASGVESFTITFYDSSMSKTTGDGKTKPAMALIEMELFDPDAIVGSTVIATEKERTMRKMSKMIFLRTQE
jgi:hypothetical protein